MNVSITNKKPADARTVVDELVSEHLGQQQKVIRDKQLQRSLTLNLMRETIGARLKDIASELRNTSIKLNTDGYGVGAGRVSAKDLELQELVRRQLELQGLSAQLRSQYQAVADMVQKGESSPKIEEY